MNRQDDHGQISDGGAMPFDIDFDMDLDVHGLESADTADEALDDESLSDDRLDRDRSPTPDNPADSHFDARELDFDGSLFLQLIQRYEAEEAVTRQLEECT